MLKIIKCIYIPFTKKNVFIQINTLANIFVPLIVGVPYPPACSTYSRQHFIWQKDRSIYVLDEIYNYASMFSYINDCLLYRFGFKALKRAKETN